MELTTDLATKLVLLATAILGLYKVAGADLKDPLSERIREALSIVIIPAAVLSLMWLFINVLPNIAKPTQVERYPVNYQSSDAEKMLAITKRFWNQDKRQEALKMTIERAFATERFDVVIEAAADLNPTSQADEVRMKAIRMLSNEPPFDSESE